MSERARPLRYPVPWKALSVLGPHIARSTRGDTDWIAAQFVAAMNPPPRYVGLENIPAVPPFIVAANHYQRRGLWIAHAASAISMAVESRTGPLDPTVRWLVTANWPPLRLGPVRISSPGDWLLPRVANAFGYYSVPFAGTNPARTAQALRRMLRELRHRPFVAGIFPEGADGTADCAHPPLPGIERFLVLLARSGAPVIPARVSEANGRFVVHFGAAIAPPALLRSDKAAVLTMQAIASLPSSN